MTDKRLVDGLNDTIRENPLAASLMGVGIFWMLFGSKVPSLAAGAPGAARAVGETLTAAGQTIIEATAQTAADVAQQITDTTQAADATAGQALSEAMPKAGRFEAIKDTGTKALRSSAEAGQHIISDAQQRFAEVLERQPLLLGALGLAIGASLASAFPTTNLEQDALSAQASAAREKLESAAAEAKHFAVERGRAIWDEIQQEAKSQGLTPEAAKRGFDDLATKVKHVADAAKDSAARRTP